MLFLLTFISHFVSIDLILHARVARPRLFSQRGDKAAPTAPAETKRRFLSVISLRPSFPSFLIKLANIFRTQDEYPDRDFNYGPRPCAAKCATASPRP